jgi:hypothetical protein
MARVAPPYCARCLDTPAGEDNKMKAILLAVLSPPSWTILGLALTIVGVFLLFLFGMPYSLRLDEGDYLTTEQATTDRLNTVYSVLGWIGVALIFVGTGCQIVSLWVSA